MTPEHLAGDAERLIQDPVFQEALAELRIDMLNSLAVTDPTDTIEISWKQAYCRVCEDLPGKLAEFIVAVQRSGVDVS